MVHQCTIGSTFILIAKTNEGTKIASKVVINSWISLQPETRGGHVSKAYKFKIVAENAYRSKVLGFRGIEGSNVINEVQIQHAYMERHVLPILDPTAPKLQNQCNCKYQAYFLCFCIILYDFLIFRLKVGHDLLQSNTKCFCTTTLFLPISVN
jgi:hypothetical protein